MSNPAYPEIGSGYKKQYELGLVEVPIHPQPILAGSKELNDLKSAAQRLHFLTLIRDLTREQVRNLTKLGIHVHDNPSVNTASQRRYLEASAAFVSDPSTPIGSAFTGLLQDFGLYPGSFRINFSTYYKEVQTPEEAASNNSFNLWVSGIENHDQKLEAHLHFNHQKLLEVAKGGSHGFLVYTFYPGYSRLPNELVFEMIRFYAEQNKINPQHLSRVFIEASEMFTRGIEGALEKVQKNPKES